MPSHVSLKYGFPLFSEHSFTRVREDSYCIYGAEEDWEDLIARALGIAVVSEPTEEELYGPTGMDEEFMPQDERDRRYKAHEDYVRLVRERMSAEFGDCSLHTAGDDDQPHFFVCALRPEMPSEPRHSPFHPLADLTVAPEVDERLRKFCAALAIEYQQPRWYHVHSWYLD